MKHHKFFGLYIAGLLVLLVGCLLIWKPQPALADSPGSQISGTDNGQRINPNQIALCINVTGGDSSSPTTVTVTLGSSNTPIAAPHVATYPADDSGCTLNGSTNGGYLTAPFSGIPLLALPCTAQTGMTDNLTITAVNG